jgi:hypothetical protein
MASLMDVLRQLCSVHRIASFCICGLFRTIRNCGLFCGLFTIRIVLCGLFGTIRRTIRRIVRIWRSKFCMCFAKMVNSAPATPTFSDFPGSCSGHSRVHFLRVLSVDTPGVHFLRVLFHVRMCPVKFLRRILCIRGLH